MTRPKPAVPGGIAKFGSGSFKKTGGAAPSLHRFLVGTLVDSTRLGRQPIVVTHLGLAGAEIRTAQVHSALEPGDAVVVEMTHLDDTVAVEAFVRAVEPTRVVVVFVSLDDATVSVIESLCVTHGR